MYKLVKNAIKKLKKTGWLVSFAGLMALAGYVGSKLICN